MKKILPLIIGLGLLAYLYFRNRTQSSAQTAGAQPGSVFDQITKAVGGSDKKVSQNKGPNTATTSTRETLLQNATLQAAVKGVGDVFSGFFKTNGSATNKPIQVPVAKDPVYNYQSGVYQFGALNPNNPTDVYQFGADNLPNYALPIVDYSQNFQQPDYTNPDFNF